MIRKFKIGEEELEFEMKNKTIFELDDMYGNFGIIVNSVMQAEEGLYNNALKILCASCITKHLTPDEVEDILTPIQVIRELVPFATDLYLDYMGVKPISDSKEEVKEENKKKA